VSHALEQLADERIRGHRELVSRLRQSRRQRVLRRATRMERKAEHRLIEAWRRAAALRAQASFPPS
jgi:hypothetical protein